MALSHAPGASTKSDLPRDKNPASKLLTQNSVLLWRVLGHVALSYAPGALAESALPTGKNPGSKLLTREGFVILAKAGIQFNKSHSKSAP